MGLQSSGQISLNDVNVELGNSGTAQIGLGDSSVRDLFDDASGQISMSQGYGKANNFSMTISSNSTNVNLRTLAVNNGWDQNEEVEVTINSGVYCYATSTSENGMTINGSWPNGVTLINNGFIAGRGGNGGTGRSINNAFSTGTHGGSSGTGGGKALSIGASVSINNQGTIGGGGGGGGGGGAGVEPSYDPDRFWQGGGGGGGRSNGNGGNGGGPTTWGISNGSNGSSGSLSSAGAGGAGGGQQGNPATGAKGGDGGNFGAGGGSGSYSGSYGGGSGGSALTGNSYVTWIATGTRLGSIS
jgi:hypothetical protein